MASLVSFTGSLVKRLLVDPNCKGTFLEKETWISDTVEPEKVILKQPWWDTSKLFQVVLYLARIPISSFCFYILQSDIYFQRKKS